MKKIWYENGGRCISANAVSNFYVINNTCYKNGEDLTMLRPPDSFVVRESKVGYKASEQNRRQSTEISSEGPWTP